MGSLLQDVLGLFSKKKYTQPIPYVPSKDDFFVLSTKTDSTLNVMAYLPKVDQTLISAKQFADAIVAGTNTTYDYANADAGGKTNLTLTGSDATVDTVSLVGGTGITIASTGSDVDISVTPGTFMRSWLVGGEGGFSVTDGDSVLFIGGSKINVIGNSSNSLTLAHNNTTRVDTNTAISPAAGTSFDVIDSITQDATGHPTAVNVKTVTLPSGGGGGTVTSVDFTSDIAAFTAAVVNGTTAAALSIDLNGGTAGQFLRQDGLWATIPGGNVGTVTSVSSTTTGDALDVTVSTATSTPALAFTFAGDATQYINGAGDLVLLSTLPQGAVTSLTTTGTSGVSTLASGVLNIPDYANTQNSLTTTGTGAATLVGTVLNIPTPSIPAVPFTSLTTTGTSGAASLASGVLNIPIYPGGGTTNPAGADTEVQYNNSGAFGAGSFFTTNKSSKVDIKYELGLVGDGSNQGLLKLYCEAGTPHYVGLKGPLHSGGSSYTLQLPNTLPNVANQILESNAAGTLSWIATPTAGGGTVTDVTGTLPIVSSGGTTPDISVNTFGGATAGSAGTRGVVPIPAAGGEFEWFLKGDGTWSKAVSTISTSFPSPTNKAMILSQTNVSGPVSQLNFSAQGTAAQYVDGTFALQTMPASDNYDYWTMSDGKGTTQQVDSTDEVTFTGGTDITCAISSPDTLTINHNLFGTAGTYTYPAEIITNSTGHITSITSGSAPTTYSKWVLTGDTGSQDIEDGNTALFEGGVALTTVASATDTLTINLDNTAVTPGTYQNPEIQIDQQGRITAATNKEAAYLTYVALWNNVKGVGLTINVLENTTGLTFTWGDDGAGTIVVNPSASLSGYETAWVLVNGPGGTERTEAQMFFKAVVAGKIVLECLDNGFALSNIGTTSGNIEVRYYKTT